MSEEAAATGTQLETLRVPIDCPVELRFERSGEPVKMQAVNVSMRGMFIRTGEKYPPGALCLVHCELQDDQPPIRGRAEVIWCRERGAGETVAQLDGR